MAVGMALSALMGSHVNAQPAPSDKQIDIKSDERLAELFETVANVPVTVTLSNGAKRSGEMIVTHFRPDGPGPFPAVIINHGRSASERATPARQRSLLVTRYWVRRGFAVFVPTRLGYGATGLEPDPEFSGRCDDRNFAPMAAAATLQIRAAVTFAHSQPFVDRTRTILMGQSVGGFATTVANGQGIAGVVGSINSAGGSGGDATQRPDKPCQPERLIRVMTSTAKAGVPPMLWIYSENDRYWGKQIPRTWHKAYVDKGAKAEFVTLPSNGEDGHFQLQRLALWRPHLDRFIAGLGFKAPRTPSAPAATTFAALEDADKVPLVSDQTRTEAYPRFLQSDLPRAFVIGPRGQFAHFGGVPDALLRALARCKEFAKTDCKPYAVDDAVVWGP